MAIHMTIFSLVLSRARFAHTSGFATFARENALSLALTAMCLASMVAQIGFGLAPDEGRSDVELTASPSGLTLSP